MYTSAWGFSVARFDRHGNARASTRGPGNRTGSTFFMCMNEPKQLTTARWSKAVQMYDEGRTANLFQLP